MRLPHFAALEKLSFVKFCQSLELGSVSGHDMLFHYCFKTLFPASSNTGHIFYVYWQFDFFSVDFLFILYIHLFLSFFYYHFFGVTFYMVLFYICCQLCVLKYLIPGWGFSVISVHHVLWWRGIFHFTAAKYVEWSLLIHQHFN